MNKLLPSNIFNMFSIFPSNFVEIYAQSLYIYYALFIYHLCKVCCSKQNTGPFKTVSGHSHQTCFILKVQNSNNCERYKSHLVLNYKREYFSANKLRKKVSLRIVYN